MRVKSGIPASCNSLTVAALLALSASPVMAQNLNIATDDVTVTSGGGYNSGALKINNTTGIIPSVVLPTASVSGGTAIPNFSFAMNASGVDDGTYTFRAGFVVDDDQSNRRLEITIPSITMVFSGSGATLAGSIAANASINVRGRANDNTQVVATLTNDLFSFNGTSLSFNSGTQVTEIVGKGGILADVANEISGNGAYSYKVVLKQLSGPEVLQFGTITGGFSALKCAPSDAFVLGSNGSDYSGGFGVQGQFKIVAGTAGAAPTPFSSACTTAIPASGGGGSSSTEGSISDAADSLTSATTPEQIASAVDNANTLAASVAEQLSSGTASVETGVTLLETLNTGLGVIGTATSGGSTIDQTKVTETLNSISSLITAVSTGNSTLTTTQLNAVQTTVVTTMSNLINTVPAKADPAQSKVVMARVGEILRKVSALPGSSLTASLAEGARAISLDVAQKSEEAIQQSLSTTVTINSLADSDFASINSNVRMFISRVFDASKASINVPDESLQSAILANADDVSSRSSAVTLPAVGFDPSIVSVGTTSGSITAQQSLLNALNITGATATFDSTNRSVLLSGGGVQVPTYVTSAALIGDFLPNGTLVNNYGSIYTISDGITVTTVPAPRDPSGFFTAMESASVTSTVSEEGVVTLTAAGGEKLSGTFGFDPVTIGTLNIASPQFGTASGDPASPDYVITVTYSDGAVQKFQPMLNALELLDSTAAAGIYLTIDRSTGLITGDNGLRLRADYFVNPVTNSDANYWNANRDSLGVALRQSTDFNNDGTLDVEVITSSGKQVLYLLP